MTPECTPTRTLQQPYLHNCGRLTCTHRECERCQLIRTYRRSQAGYTDGFCVMATLFMGMPQGSPETLFDIAYEMACAALGVEEVNGAPDGSWLRFIPFDPNSASQHGRDELRTAVLALASHGLNAWWGASTA